ncbi:MAG TPA: hypothetical protein VGH29_00900 [Candidatus Binataceae bacterium]
MTPPPSGFQGTVLVDTDAPLSKWTVVDPTTGQLNALSEDFITFQKAKEKVRVEPSNRKLKEFYQTTLFSQCIATDDPRLKAK